MKKLVLFTLLICAAAAAQPSYPTMAPVNAYRIPDRDAEIALARSAAPPSIAQAAEVLVLGAKGFETAVQGKNGFVCFVERSWAKDTDDPEFWNPKMRAPTCLNPAAARAYLPISLKKTEWVLAGVSREQVAAKLKSAFAQNTFPPFEPGAMAYMLSKQSYLSDAGGHWHPHIMFYVGLADPAAWTDNQDHAPVLAAADREEHLTVIFVPVARWSDNTPDASPH